MNISKNPFNPEVPFFRRWLSGWLPFWAYSTLVFKGAILPASQIPRFLYRFNDKFLHASEFFVLFFISEHAFHMAKRWLSRHPGILAYGYCAFMGVATEVAQHFAKDRTPEFYDFLADIAGAGLAFLCYLLILLHHYRRTGAARRGE